MLPMPVFIIVYIPVFFYVVKKLDAAVLLSKLC